MAAPSNSFRQVDGPEPGAVTVTLREGGADVVGEVLGPEASGPGRPFSMGQDGSLSAQQALAVGCHLANETGAEVVIVDSGGRWRPDWGRLVSP